MHRLPLRRQLQQLLLRLRKVNKWTSILFGVLVHFMNDEKINLIYTM